MHSMINFFRQLRPRSSSTFKEKDNPRVREKAYINVQDPPPDYKAPIRQRARSSDPTAKLPAAVLERIFAHVCPHSQDETYLPCEDSVTDDGCMLCDTRDLAQCAAVNRQWNKIAQKRLYSSIRVDAVHFCELEIELARKRKRRTRFDKNGDPRDPASQRLHLFSRTVRENVRLGALVFVLKVPYMTRETCKADLARTVSALPNLKYVDLPDGFFNDDSSCRTLRTELLARCPDIRMMQFHGGAEHSFETIARDRTWQSLEILQLEHLDIEPSRLVEVLNFLPALQELKLTNLPWLDDATFEPSPMELSFISLQKLWLKDTPNVTATGLVQYLSGTRASKQLSALTLDKTGVLPSDLQSILAAAPALTHLSFTDTVSQSLSNPKAIAPLRSKSLVSLNYEIMSAASSSPRLDDKSRSYYTYLRYSLLASGLPSLETLYVRDPSFANSLTTIPPSPGFAPNMGFPSPHLGDSGRSTPSFLGSFPQTLAIFSKGLDELEWNFTSVTESDLPGRRPGSSRLRPVSEVRGLGPQWGGDARKSVMVGNGFGGFLAVPTENVPMPRPWSAGASPANKSSKQDLWR